MSIAEDIRNAITELKGDEPAPVTETPQGAAPEAEAPAEEPAAEEKTSKRGADGKFVAKDAEVGQDETVKAETPESIRPPASWSPAAKAKFLALDPDIQQEVLRREKETDKGFRERAEQLKRYEPLENVIAPRRDLWAAQGLDEATAIKTLLAAQDLLEKNPVQGLTYLARSYGVDLASVAGQSGTQPAAGTTGQPLAQPDPVAAELQALKAELQSIKNGREQEVQSTYQAQIDAFASDPANIYFENVRPQMAALISAGVATDLPSAYQQAIWADPNIRPLLLQEQATPKDQAREHAAKAKAASVSVTGSPGASPPMASNGTIRDDIRLAIQQVSGRA